MGRSFLATGDAWVGVKDKIVVFQVNGERVILNIERVMRYLSEPKNLESVDVGTQSVIEILDSLVQKTDEEKDNPELMDNPEFEETTVDCRVVRALISAEENGDSNQASVSTDDLVESQVGELFDFLQQCQ